MNALNWKIAGQSAMLKVNFTSESKLEACEFSFLKNPYKLFFKKSEKVSTLVNKCKNVKVAYVHKVLG